MQRPPHRQDLHSDGVTVMPDENRPAAPQALDLMSLRDGQTVEITTRSSTYWITKTNRACPGGQNRVYGFSVHTDSRLFGQITSAPLSMCVDSQAIIGRPFGIASGHTGIVKNFRLL